MLLASIENHRDGICDERIMAEKHLIEKISLYIFVKRFLKCFKSDRPLEFPFTMGPWLAATRFLR